MSGRKCSAAELADLDAAIKLAAHNLRAYARVFADRDTILTAIKTLMRGEVSLEAIQKAKDRRDQACLDLELAALDFSQATSRRCTSRPFPKPRTPAKKRARS